MNRIVAALTGFILVAASLPAQNTVPVGLNLPAGNTFLMSAGDTQLFSLDFSGPESGQIVDIAVNSYGLPSFTFVVTPGTTANVSGSFASSLAMCGNHVVTLTVTDDGPAPDNTTVVDVFFNVFGLFTLTITQPGGSGSLKIENTCGTPGQLYFTAITDDQNNINGCPKCGWWFGMFIPMNQLVGEFLTQAPPFVGALDSNGNSVWSVPGGTIPPHSWYCFAKTVTFVVPTYMLNLVTTTVPFMVL